MMFNSTFTSRVVKSSSLQAKRHSRAKGSYRGLWTARGVLCKQSGIAERRDVCLFPEYSLSTSLLSLSLGFAACYQRDARTSQGRRPITPFKLFQPSVPPLHSMPALPGSRSQSAPTTLRAVRLPQRLAGRRVPMLLPRRTAAARLGIQPSLQTAVRCHPARGTYRPAQPPQCRHEHLLPLPQRRVPAVSPEAGGHPGLHVTVWQSRPLFLRPLCHFL